MSPGDRPLQLNDSDGGGDGDDSERGKRDHNHDERVLHDVVQKYILRAKLGCGQKQGDFACVRVLHGPNAELERVQQAHSLKRQYNADNDHSDRSCLHQCRSFQRQGDAHTSLNGDQRRETA